MQLVFSSFKGYRMSVVTATCALYHRSSAPNLLFFILKNPEKQLGYYKLIIIKTGTIVIYRYITM